MWSSKTAWKLDSKSGRLSVAGLRAARPSDSLVRGDVLGVLVGESLEILLAVSDGLGVAAEQGGDIVEAAMPELGRLDGGVAAAVVLAKGLVEDPHGEFDIRGIGEGDGHSFGPHKQGIWCIPYHRCKQNRLTPRASFELWQESVRFRSGPWKSVEIDAAARLRLLAMELVVSRAEHLAELNADLARSNEELDAFAYVASHDLKEPLRGIQKYAHQLLEQADAFEGENRKRLEGLARLTLRMDGLLDSLLHFSRVGRIKLEYHEADLDEVLAEALEMVGARTEEGRTQFVIPRPLGTVSCDRIRVREIFVNLLSNALKYNDRTHRRIEIGYVARGERWDRGSWPESAVDQTAYYVRDDGIGIDRRHFDQIFRMFKRLHGRGDYGGGTGAGLTIVKKLVERHRGAVWLDSVPGEGSTFYFTLPCDEDLR